MSDRITITVRLDEPLYERLNAKKEAAGMSWEGLLKQADLSHIRTEHLPDGVVA